MGGKRRTYGLILAVCLVLGGWLPPVVSAQGGQVSPPDCLAYAFSSSESHHFLARDGSIMFGSNVTVEHNCARVEVYLNGTYAGGTNASTFNVPIPPGEYDILIHAPATNQTWNHSVQVIPDRLGWEYEWIQLQLERPTFIDQDDSTRMQNWAAGITALIIWVLTTYVWWNLINSFIQRNFVEEVA